MLPTSLGILEQACKAHGYTFSIIDDFSKSLVEISDGEKSFFSGAGKLTPFPLNSAVAHRIAQDKAHTKNILKKKGFSVPKGEYFFIFPEDFPEGDIITSCIRENNGYDLTGKRFSDALKFAKNFGYPLFVKPNTGSHGVLAEKVENEQELRQQLENISKKSYISLLEEVLQGDEYRIFVLDGEIQFSYKRKSPKIIGDGKKTIEELLGEHNQRLKNKKNKIKNIEKFCDTFSIGSANKIFPKDEILYVSSKTNLHAGGEILEYSEKHTKELKDWVKEISQATTLRIFGVDIFSEKGISNPKDITILEINSSPGLSGIYEYGKKEKVMNIWGKILKKIL